MPAAKSILFRGTALVFAGAINAGYLLALQFERRETRHEPAAAAMQWIVLALPAEAPALIPEPTVRSPRRAEALVMPLPPVPGEPAAPLPSDAEATGADAAPEVDWTRAAAEVARAYVPDEQPPMDSLVLPRMPRHERGELETRDGGVLITWANDLCYYVRDPMAEERWARKYCKVRSASERLSTDLAEGLEEVAKPRNLGGSRKLPALPETHIRLP